MLRILPLCAWTAVACGASTLEQAGDDIRRPRASITTADDREDDAGSWLLEISTSTSSTNADEPHPEALFADSPPPARQVAAPAERDGAEPRWWGELGVAAGRTHRDLWRWRVDGALRYQMVGLGLRLDAWREDDDGRTVMATLTAIGPQLAYRDDTQGLAWTIGLPLLIWHDTRGEEYGLAATLQIEVRPPDLPLVVTMEGLVGGVGEADYIRVGASVGPAWKAVALHCGYEHATVGEVHLGGPFARLTWSW